MSDSLVTNDAHMEQKLALYSTHPWLQHYEQGVPTQLDIPQHSLTWLLDQAVSHYPDHSALIYYGTKLSYLQFSCLANRFAVGLQQLGVRRGDRVAIALPNIPQFPIAFYGALRAGAVVVPTNPLYTEREMQHQLADSGASVMVMLDTFYPVVRAVRAKTALEHVIITSAADFLPPMLHILYLLSQRRAKNPELHLSGKERHSDKTLHAMRAMLHQVPRQGRRHGRNELGPYDAPTRYDGTNEPIPSKGRRPEIDRCDLLVQCSGDDLAVLQYTGGTTGLSKGAMLTHYNLLANAMQTRSWTPKIREAEEVTLCIAPFFHSYGLTVGMNLSILLAATMVLLPRFKAKDVVKAIRRHHPSLFPGIPTMYLAIIREVGETSGKHAEQLSSIKYCISGAAPLPTKVRMDFEALTHGKLVEGYGLSEAAPVTHCNPLNGDIRDGSVGLPLPNIEAAIVDQKTGVPVPLGEVGEIVVKGPNSMRGYWQRNEETAAIFTNGWMHTGDLGKMDEDGYFYVTERSKDMIIASGFNVYPREVEEVLFQHPAVQEAAVIGMPDEYRGETIVAFVVLKPGVAVVEDIRQDILAHCKHELAAYKIPKKLEFRDSLPKSLIGKVLRRELRSEMS